MDGNRRKSLNDQERRSKHDATHDAAYKIMDQEKATRQDKTTRLRAARKALDGNSDAKGD